VGKIYTESITIVLPVKIPIALIIKKKKGCAAMLNKDGTILFLTTNTWRGVPQNF